MLPVINIEDDNSPDSLTLFMDRLSVSNGAAIANLKKGGYVSVRNLRVLPPDYQDLEKYGFNDFEKKIILREIETMNSQPPSPKKRGSARSSQNRNECMVLSEGDKPRGGNIYIHNPSSRSGTDSITGSGKSGSSKTSSESMTVSEGDKSKGKRVGLTVPTTTGAWYWKNDEGVYVSFDSETAKFLEDSYVQKKEVAVLETKAFIGKSYIVDLRAMKQRNMITGNERKVKRQVGDKRSPRIKPPQVTEDFEEFCAAAFNKDIRKFMSLLPKYSSEQLINLRNSRGQSVLYCAASGGSYEITKKLISLDIPVSQPQGPKLSTPLHGASWKGHPEVVSLLIVSKANVHALNEMGLKPEHEAQSAAKFAWEIYEAEGVSGVKRLIPTPSSTFHLTLKSAEDLSLSKDLFAEKLKVDVIISIFDVEHKSPLPLAKWKIEQEVSSNSWEWGDYEKRSTSEKKTKKVMPLGQPKKNRIKMNFIDMNRIRVNMKVIQSVESAQQNALEAENTPNLIGEENVEIELDDLLKGKTVNFHLKSSGDFPDAGNIKASYSMEPLDAIAMKKITDKIHKDSDCFDEKQMIEFYMKLRQSLSDFRASQLSTSKKGGLKTTLKKKLAQFSDEKEITETEIFGLNYPQLNFNDFNRAWESLDPKYKLKHLLGHMVYVPPLLGAAALSHEPFRTFVEKKLLPMNFVPIIEKVHMHNQHSLTSLCVAIAKHIVEKGGAD